MLCRGPESCYRSAGRGAERRGQIALWVARRWGREMGVVDRSLFLPGNRVGVLLIHGLGGTPLEVKSIARGLNASGFTVHCCQLAGHCGSEEDLLATDRHDWFRSVEEALTRLEQRCSTIVVGGLSMGAI